MIDKTNKVNPRNGVDFSRIRKHVSGGTVTKYQQPASGITHNPNTTWYGNVFSGFKAELLKALKENPNLFKDVNAMLDWHAVNTGNNPTLTPTKFDQSVFDYQDEINKNFSYVNNLGITGGHDAGRYVYGQKDADKRFNKDNASTNWAPDGYRSGQDKDRILLGYDGDFTPEQLTAWNNELKPLGLETYLDGSVYKLKQLSSQPGLVSEQDSSAEDTSSSPTSKVSKGNYTPDDYSVPDSFEYEKTPWTSWIPNLGIMSHSLAANRAQYLNDMLKKVALDEALHQDYTVTDDKATTDAYNQAGVNIQSQANRIASQSSNLELNQDMQLEGAQLAEEKKLQGQLAKTQAYNQSIQEAQLVANWNNQLSAQTANVNRQRLVADWNRRLNDKSRYQIQKHGIIADNIIKNATDYGNYVQGERQREDAALQDYNNYKANLDKQGVWKDYYDLAGDSSKSDAFKSSYDLAFARFNEIKGLSNLTGDDALLVDYFAPKDGTASKGLQGWGDLLKSNYNAQFAKDFNTAYKTELGTLEKLALSKLQAIDNALLATHPYFNPTHSNQGFFVVNKDPKKRYVTPIFEEGGILKAKNGNRMVKYLEHSRKKILDKLKNNLALLESNRKARADLNKIATENAKLLQESIKRELESLDRETLLLLRSVFK